MANRVKGLFLDLDGTLADSLPAMRVAYDAFLNRFEKAGSDAEFDGFNGPPLEHIVAALAKIHGLLLPVDELTAVYKETIRATYEDVTTRSGAEELLETAKGLGLKICVVTSNFDDLTWAWLRRVGLNEMVDAVVACEAVGQGKPNPQAYFLALTKTACVAEESLAVEDSVTGARASMAAGIRTLFLSEASTHVPPGTSRISRLSEVTTFLVNDSQ